MHDRPPPDRTICRIGPLTLDLQSDVVLRDGRPLALGRRAGTLLRRLVEHPGEIVSKDALYDAVWPGLAVEESNLTVQISQLRRVLRAEVAGGDGWIETLARRGYRFTGPASWHTTTPTHGPAPSPAPPMGARVVRSPTISNIPIAVPLHFTGRAAALAGLNAALTDVPHRPAIAALHGLRGVGKTILAAAFAAQHEGAYRATWWLRAETITTLRADLAALAIRLQWASPGAQEEIAFAAALDGLRQDGDGLLLIYDDAVDAVAVRPYLPKAGATHIIVTSNAPTWRAYATPLELTAWPAAVGADYLIARTGRDGQRQDAEALSEALGGLPLAHEQAAAYIESIELSFADYLRRFDLAPARLLDDVQHAPADYHDGTTVAKAFHLAIEQAASLHPASEALLEYAALLAPEPIPVFLLREGRELLGEPLATQLADDGLDEALAALRGYALISRELVPDEHDAALRTDSLRLHRLVRQVVAARLSDEAVAARTARLIAALAAVYPWNGFDTPAVWPRIRRLDALAMPLVAPPAVIPDGIATSASTLLGSLASFRHGALGAFGQARPLFERAHALAEATMGPDHPDTANTLNNLALLMRDHGDLAAARPLQARALAIREATLGPHHRDTAGTLNNLANILHATGDSAAARPLFERALAIYRSEYGDNHHITALSMNNLARALHRLGELQAAFDMHSQALALRETCLEPGHHYIANSLHNLGQVLLDMGRPEEACALGERAVGMAERALGPEHPETANIRGQLARSVFAARGATAALPLAERALATLSATLAPGAVWVRAAATVTANCLDALGRPADAVAIRRQHLPAVASR